MNFGKVILSLCDFTGEWARPYLDAGYDVRQIDIKRGTGDVRLLKKPQSDVYGILAAPPCTVFANSGAWVERSEDDMRAALSIVDACLRLVAICRPTLQFWALENPIGKLNDYLGRPRLIFDPCDYGDPYTKATCLWGDFKIPPPRETSSANSGKQSGELAAKAGRKIGTDERVAERDAGRFCARVFRCEPISGFAWFLPVSVTRTAIVRSAELILRSAAASGPRKTDTSTKSVQMDCTQGGKGNR